jgi:DNA polymerase-3 subunit delta'
MAAKRAAAAAAAPVTVAARLALAAAPWLGRARAQVEAAWQAGRFHHALLVVGRAGLGHSELALWCAQFALCEAPKGRPCGRCPSCTLFVAGNHPDFRAVTFEEDARVIKVDQIRDLSAALAMRSYRGGRQVGLIDPADAMNINSFNALLKTLEEPSEGTVLILAATRPAALPATVQSRCLRLAVAPPAPAEAQAWLAGQPGRADWSELLALANGAPFAALELAGQGAAELGKEVARDLASLGTAAFDPWGLAEAWVKDRPEERLHWLEHQMGRWIKEVLATGDAVNNNRVSGLPRPRAGMNIGPVFEFLDRLRDARAGLEGPLNAQLLLEDLLVALGETFAAAARRTG